MRRMNAPLLTTFQEDTSSLRAFRRFSLDLTIGVSLSSDTPAPRGTTSPRTKASMTNASMSGCCFASLTEFPEDTLIELELEVGRQIHRVPAVVRRCLPAKRLGRTFYECGAQYVKSDATLRFLPCMVTYLMASSGEDFPAVQR